MLASTTPKSSSSATLMVIYSLLGVVASLQWAHAARVCEASSPTYSVSHQVSSTTVDRQLSVLNLYEECDSTRFRDISNKDRPH